MLLSFLSAALCVIQPLTCPLIFHRSMAVAQTASPELEDLITKAAKRPRLAKIHCGAVATTCFILPMAQTKRDAASRLLLAAAKTTSTPQRDPILRAVPAKTPSLDAALMTSQRPKDRPLKVCQFIRLKPNQSPHHIVAWKVYTPPESLDST